MIQMKTLKKQYSKIVLLNYLYRKKQKSIKMAIMTVIIILFILNVYFERNGRKIVKNGSQFSKGK